MRKWILLLVGLAALVAFWSGGGVRERPNEPTPAGRTRGVSAAEVVVYSRPSCGWCRKAMAWLDARDIGYDNRDIEADPQSRERLVDLTGHTSVPVVVIEGQLVRGYDPERMRSLLAAR